MRNRRSKRRLNNKNKDFTNNLQTSVNIEYVHKILYNFKLILDLTKTAFLFSILFMFSKSDK